MQKEICQRIKRVERKKRILLVYRVIKDPVFVSFLPAKIMLSCIFLLPLLFANPAEWFFLLEKNSNEKRRGCNERSYKAVSILFSVYIFNPEIYAKPKSYGQTNAGSYGRIKRTCGFSRKFCYNSGTLFTDIVMK